MTRTILATLLLIAAPAAAGILVTVQPENENQAFGEVTAWLGDVNDDGYDDFLVLDSEQAGDDYAGRAYVYFGGAVPDAQPDLVLQQDASGKISQVLQGPFDFNGDGYGDIALSAPYYDTNDMENTGAVFIYYGGPGIDDVVDHVIPGPWTDYYLGTSLAKAGHFDPDDEYDDLAVTLDPPYGWGPGQCAYVYTGGPSPSTEKYWGRVWPDSDDAHDGRIQRMRFAGDVNGDGRGDIAFGTPWSTGIGIAPDGTIDFDVPNSGGALVILGGEDRLWMGLDIFQITLDSCALGSDLDGAFDFDGDGRDDLILGAPGIEKSLIITNMDRAGSAFTTALTLIPGNDVAGLGDVDGDGYDDVAVADLANAVWIFQGGADADSLPDQVLYPEFGEEWDEIRVERAGDIDGDGLDDILVHFTDVISYGVQTDRVRIYSGNSCTVDVPEVVNGTPVLAFEGNRPNPFNPSTEIVFRTAVDTRVQVRLFDLNGRLIRSLSDARYEAGLHREAWDGRNDLGQEMPSGSYVVQILGAGRAAGGKIMLVR